MAAGPASPTELEPILGRWWTEGHQVVHLLAQGAARGPACRRGLRAVHVSIFETGGADRWRSLRAASAASCCGSCATATAIEKLYWATYPMAPGADLLQAFAGLEEDRRRADVGDDQDAPAQAARAAVVEHRTAVTSAEPAMTRSRPAETRGERLDQPREESDRGNQEDGDLSLEESAISVASFKRPPGGDGRPRRSAAFPTIATMTAATKKSDTWRFSAKTSNELTSTSATSAVATVAMPRMKSETYRPRGFVGVVLGVKLAVTAELRPGHADVDEQEHDRHGDREHLGACAFADTALPVRDRDDEEERVARRGQHDGHQRRDAVDLTLRADEQREPEDEEEVAEDAPRQRAAHDLEEPVVDREEGDDQLGRVPEGRVEEAADAGPVCSAACSVASPISQARGTSAIAARTKSVTSSGSIVNRTTIVSGARPSDAQRSRRATRTKPTGVPLDSMPEPDWFVKTCAAEITVPTIPVMELGLSAAQSLPLHPQDEVECRRCGVHCDKIVYPAACIDRACPFVYAYEEFGHTYIGCMQKVYEVEIDVDLLREAERRRGGFGAVGARGASRCRCAGSSVDGVLRESRAARRSGAVNPEFHEVPRARPSFRVIAQITPR